MDLQGGLRLFSGVWSENAALFERFMKIHSNPPILYYGINLGVVQLHILVNLPIFLALAGSCICI